MTMRERMEQGKLFTDMCEGLPKEREKAKKLMLWFNESDPQRLDERLALLEEIFGVKPVFWIEPPFHFCYGHHITIGKGTYINMNCNFVDDGKITIGDNVLFGPAVTIATVGHPVEPTMHGYMYCDPVTIGNNCWIGAAAVILPGVTIGDNTVIGAGSVVTKDIPANVVAAGNPCRVIRPIGEQDKKYYYQDRPIDPEDLEEERKLREENGWNENEMQDSPV